MFNGGHIVVVSGGRDYKNESYVIEQLDAFHKSMGIRLLVHGACYPKANRVTRALPRESLDYLAGLWASNNGVDQKPFPADWNTHGRAAGPIRNKEMLEWAGSQYVKGSNLVIFMAFPGGKGTNGCFNEAYKLGKFYMIDLRREPPVRANFQRVHLN